MITRYLLDSLDCGLRRIGQIEILRDTCDTRDAAFALCHIDDVGRLDELEVYRDPRDAREISTWAEDGHYRFTKGELSLKTGWIFLLDSAEDLRRTLDFFYPAAVGLWVARENGTLEVENLRDKLNRQTGMYKFARGISDQGAQQLVRETCGPGNCCVKQILWKLDEGTPLEDSEASRYEGVIDPEVPSIPLVCREACNHFVAECRKVSKAEFEAKSAG